LYETKRRQQAGRQGGLTTAAYHDPRTTSAAGRLAAETALNQRLLVAIDPENELEPQERAKRLERARKAYFLSLSMKAAAARRRNKARKAVAE
jgi:hypothetical protein